MILSIYVIFFDFKPPVQFVCKEKFVERIEISSILDKIDPMYLPSLSASVDVIHPRTNVLAAGLFAQIRAG